MPLLVHGGGLCSCSRVREAFPTEIYNRRVLVGQFKPHGTRVLIDRASDAGTLVTVSIGVIGLGISTVKSAGTIGLLPR
jgi:hypothetical protein